MSVNWGAKGYGSKFTLNWYYGTFFETISVQGMCYNQFEKCSIINHYRNNLEMYY